MKKIALALILTTALAGTAEADYYRGRGYHHGGGGNWVAPLVGGMILGGAIYGLSQPSYAAPPVYVAPPQYRTECQIVPVYDRYGYYRGERRDCYQVPNY
jgi:hypothetical protein